MQKTISASELRTYIRRVLNEVGYSRAEYLIEKFGEPIAALISVEDFQLLQSIKQQQNKEPHQNNVSDPPITSQTNSPTR